MLRRWCAPRMRRSQRSRLPKLQPINRRRHRLSFNVGTKTADRVSPTGMVNPHLKHRKRRFNLIAPSSAPSLVLNWVFRHTAPSPWSSGRGPFLASPMVNGAKSEVISGRCYDLGRKENVSLGSAPVADAFDLAIQGDVSGIAFHLDRDFNVRLLRRRRRCGLWCADAFEQRPGGSSRAKSPRLSKASR